jgi:hypothetical protein
MNTLKQHILIHRMQSEILADVERRIVPETVRSFGDLHDYVDANEYGGICEPGADADIDDVNAAQTAVSDWIAEGGITAILTRGADRK